jgi:hypothetical protein
MATGSRLKFSPMPRSGKHGGKTGPHRPFGVPNAIAPIYGAGGNRIEETR